MNVGASRFTPQVLFSAPRRSAGTPNLDGTKILYTSSEYSFERHKKTTGLYVLSSVNNESQLITSDETVSSPVWLEDDHFLVLRTNKDKTEVVVVDCSAADSYKYAQVAGSIGAAAADLKIARLSKDQFAVVVSAEAGPDGELFNPDGDKAYSSGRLYKTLFVRHWDQWAGRGSNALWYNVLQRQSEGSWAVDGDWKNALAGGERGLECPMKPFGGTDHFDVSPTGIIFVSKDPTTNPALNTKVVARVLDLKTFKEDPPVLQDFDLPGIDGAKSSPVFSPDGKRLAYLAMKTNGYESDRNEIVVALDIDVKDNRLTILQNSSTAWDRSPSSVKFTLDGKSLLLTADDQGVTKIFVFGIDSDVSGPNPRVVTVQGSVSDVQPLASGAIFASASSLIDNSFYSIIPHSTKTHDPLWAHSSSKSGSSFGLSRKQVSSIWSPASNPKINKTIHSWVVRPSFHDPAKKYPLALLVHGGPQYAWTDSWNTRWNAAVFAEQGYIVVAPNPTGSTSYGQDFTDAIRRDWGGAPYEDLINVFDYVAANCKDVDTDNAVALGGSYGGYMMNWINGHDFGRRFKALVNHDGMFSTTGLWATEELYFPFRDLGGLPFHQTEKSMSSSAELASTHGTFASNALKYWIANDPSQHLHNWNTPTLIIHSTNDYRHPISEGLSSFNVLQAKGVESQFLHFPDENHWVLKPENCLVWHKTVLNWIHKFTGLDQIANEAESDLKFYGGRVPKDDPQEASKE